MKIIHNVELRQGSKEEVLPGFSPEFPHISSYAELDQYIGRQAPWHWHKEVELFYMERGELEYDTPRGKLRFCAGSGGFINSNVLHMSRAMEGHRKVTQLLHLFDPLLISGQKGSTIDRKYVTPLTTASQIEIVALSPENPDQRKVLEELRSSFELQETGDTYEIRLRAVLSELWCQILKAAQPQLEEKGDFARGNDKIKTMMVYIHEHYADKITVAELAASAYCSERECYRIFRGCLKEPPVEYITDYRIQRACQMLAEGEEPVTSICQSCGLGSSSYFGKVFKARTGLSPVEYRSKWQDSDIKRQK